MGANLQKGQRIDVTMRQTELVKLVVDIGLDTSMYADRDVDDSDFSPGS